MSVQPPPLATPDPVDAAAYAWVLEHGRLDPGALAGHLAALGLDPAAAAPALARLAGWGLVHSDPQDPARGRAVGPSAAVDVLTGPIEAQIAHCQQQLAEGRARLAGFLPYYLDGGRPPVGDGLRVIATLPEVRAALDRASAECRREVLASQPGGGARVPEAMQEALRRDRALLARGVRMRTLYHHTARFNGPSQAYVEAAAGLGAEYRTLHELFGRLIVFDRSRAFVPLSDGSTGAVVVTEESLVAYLCEIFDQAWAVARPFASAAEEGLGQVAQEIDRTILRLLAGGLKDETIARRVGLSLRTARRHIADIMAQLGAESRFQAGVAAARAGLLDD
ncbi:LuxR family transcriptional regulator [Kitasatospora sp. MMS16-BH015]|uniref:LuxR C-terminal-related transcriptional regulator n=1 Tax=Kitasatospora sp. MMS16-BH015 TaxID=2018025 RepID=UPI000CA0F720|nr:LuxR C-terminal-related transcriptional regulator [Kitasatospora sp. MMS16-BH015]AUG77931.1 LuxR family transcriptional regulator [Kitasatospora sp. MMS16-BH015]